MSGTETENLSDQSGEGVAPPAAGADQPRAAVDPGKRKRLFLILGIVVLVLGGGYFLYSTFIASRTAETDNAYVSADTAQVTPLTAGQVTELVVTDTQEVTKGQLLFRLAGIDQRATLAQVEADYAATRRRYQQTREQGAALGASADARAAALGAARARVAAAEGDLARARTDLGRRQGLVGPGAVSADEVTAIRNNVNGASARLAEARAALAQAEADVASARASSRAAQALVAGTSVDTAPEVRAAAARLETARLDVARTEIRAPVSGVVAKLAIQVGQKVSPGSVAMIIVPIERLYVLANFKENQLGRVRPGQPVTLHSDFYGSGVTYHGKVVGFAGGTGAAFAPIPAQNATGNWIKVVQRLPVRVALDPRELREHPLRVGLSMTAEIDLTATR